MDNPKLVELGVSAFSKLIELWKTGRGCDVSIICKNDVTIKAHSLVLCLVSDKLDDLLFSLPNTDKLISSPDVDASVWKTLLEIIYTRLFLGNTTIDNVSLEKCTALAQSLGMNCIVQGYDKLIGQKSIENFNEILQNVKGPADVQTVENSTSYSGIWSFDNCNPSVMPEQKFVRKKLCYECRSKCMAEKVKCLLCCKVVTNDVSHIESDHPFTPNTSTWVYTCQFSRNENDCQDWRVCKKEHLSMIDNSSNKVMCSKFYCCLCKGGYTSSNEVVKHLKVSHDVIAKLCKVCGTGFETMLQYRDHEYFCRGGEFDNSQERGTIFGELGPHASHKIKHMQEKHSFKNDMSKLNDENICDSGFDVFTDRIIDRKVEKNTDSKRKKMKHRSENCIKCGTKCKAKRVKCLYCFSVVNKSSSHMDKFHPFTPYDSLWVYHCKYISSSSQNEKYVVCGKEYNNQHIFHNRCYKCQEVFTSTLLVEKHLRKEHNILPYICSMCSMGFLKEHHCENHEYFCKGGPLLFCKICFRKMSGLKQLKDHMKKNHLHEKLLENKIVNFADLLDNNSSTSSLFDTCQSQEDLYQDNKTLRNELFCSECDLYFSSFCKFFEHNSEEHGIVTELNKIQQSHERRSSGRRIAINPKYKDYVTDFNFTSISTKKSIDKNKLDSENNEDIPSSTSCGQVINFDKSVIQEPPYGIRSANFELLEVENTEIVSANKKENQEMKKEKFGNSETVYINGASNLPITSDIPQKIKNQRVQRLSTSSGVCCHCNGSCSAIKVRCYYCFDVVENDILHKENYHPFSHHNSIWVFSCNFSQDKFNFITDPVIFLKVEYHNESTTLIQGPLIKCLKCENLFLTIEDLRKHVTQKFKCNICKLVFSTLNSVCKHVEKVHKRKYYTCYQCESGYSSHILLKEHEYFCKGGAILECDLCGMELCGIENLKTHIHDEHPNSFTDFQDEMDDSKKTNNSFK